MRLYTEKEHIIQNQHFAFKLRDLFLNDYRTFQQLSDYIPLSIHINKKENYDIVFANNKLIDKGPEIEILFEKGGSFLKEISCPILLENAQTKSKKFKIINDKDAICAYPQQIRMNSEMTYFYSTKLHLDDHLYFIVSNVIDELGSLNMLFSSVFSTLQKNQTTWLQFQSLTKQEKVILRLLANGHSNKLIADQLFNSIHTVQSHRKNINKKLNITSIADLVKYALALDLL
tara:strand:- start:1966 stop:2658 length:693 start_codon:yes stop_codon:yes gene_type:complete